MIMSIASPDLVAAEEIAADELTVLGRDAHGTVYAATADKREVKVGKPLTAPELANPVGPNEIRIREERRVPVEGLEGQRTTLAVRHVRAWIVPSGTFAQLQAQAKARASAKAAAKARKHTPALVDAASFLVALDPLPARTLQLDTPRDLALAAMSRRGQLLEIAGREPIRGVEAIARWLREDQGVELDVAGERLVVRATALNAEVARVIEVFEPLLAGWAAKHPVLCALSHTSPVPAFTLALPSLPVCEQHLGA